MRNIDVCICLRTCVILYVLSLCVIIYMMSYNGIRDSLVECMRLVDPHAGTEVHAYMYAHIVVTNFVYIFANYTLYFH